MTTTEPFSPIVSAVINQAQRVLRSLAYREVSALTAVLVMMF
ncbi:MAG: hypothetical protein AAF493_29385 [Pseudomonadota bacterium]